MTLRNRAGNDLREVAPLGHSARGIAVMVLPRQQSALRRLRRKLGSLVAYCFSWYRY